MGRADLIGNGRKQLIPFFQPAGTGLRGAPPERVQTAGRAAVPARVVAANAARTKC
jgi:hypothetical protein